MCGICSSICYKILGWTLKLVLFLLILDLSLTMFITISLWNADVFACCTSTNPTYNTDSWVAKCTYEDIGKAENIDDTSLGYCERRNGDVCDTGLDTCASDNSYVTYFWIFNIYFFFFEF